MATKMQGKGSVTLVRHFEHKLKRIRDGCQPASRIAEYPHRAAGRLGLPRGMEGQRGRCAVRRALLGTGHRETRNRFKNPDEIQTLPEIQAKILANCAQYVKKGGTLVYSTCTILQRENERTLSARSLEAGI